MTYNFKKMKPEDITFIEENISYFKTNKNPMSVFWFRLFDIANYIKGFNEYTDIGCGRCLKSVKDFCYSQYKQNGGLL